MGGTQEQSDCRNLSKSVIGIVGPTASGKSALAQVVALECSGEIVSADSMQVYRGMDIGTGKVREDEMKVPHWGIDLCDPDKTYSASLFQTYARECFRSINERGNRSILCGGTGLYVRAAIDDFVFPHGEQVNNPIRERYTVLAEQEGPQAVWDVLYERDSESARLIHPNNVRRVIRALEMHEEGVCYAQQAKNLQTLPQKIPAFFFGLHLDSAILNARIDDRVDSMIAHGLLDEVKNLLEKGFYESLTAPQAIGYKEIVDVFDGKISLDEAAEAIKVATHRYAKRQRTWFRKDKRIEWLHADSGDTDVLAQVVLSRIDTMDKNQP